MKRPNSVIFLIVCFGWLGLKAVEKLIWFQDSANYSLLEAVGAQGLHFGYAIATAVLCLGACLMLLRPRAISMPVAGAAVAVSLLAQIHIGIVGLLNPDLLKESIANFTSFSGRTIPPVFIDMMTSAPALISIGAAVALLHVAMFYFLYRNREYLRGTSW